MTHRCRRREALSAVKEPYPNRFVVQNPEHLRNTKRGAQPFPFRIIAVQSKRIGVIRPCIVGGERGFS